MKRLVSLVICAALGASAAVRPDENLVINGVFEAEQTVLPSFWSSRFEKSFPLHSSGGPDGKPYVSVLPDAEKAEVSLRQYGLHLSGKGRYRIVAWVRTKGFSASDVGIGVANFAWKSGRNVAPIPPDTHGTWVRLEGEFANFDSVENKYFFYVFATHPKGTLDVADVALYAVDETACRETQITAMAQAQTEPRLLPIAPLLWQIPLDDPRVTFKFYGRLPGGTFADYDAVLQVEGEMMAKNAGRGRPDHVARAASPLRADGTVRLAFPREERQGAFTVALVRRADGKAFAAERRTYRVREVGGEGAVETKAAGHRRLNNFVTEVLAAKVEKGKRLTFITVRGGWVHVEVEGARARTPLPQEERGQGVPAMHGERLASRVSFSIDGVAADAFRYVEAGEHTLAVEGADGGTVVVRAISETFNYCPGISSGVKENPPYDWAFQTKYGLPAITTENGGSIPPEARAAFHASGRLWLANVQTVKQPAEVIARRIAESSGMKAPEYDGVTCDEQGFHEPDQLYEYTKGLKLYDFANSPVRRIYSWAIGKPTSSPVDTDFIVTAINASRGRGHVMIEAYLGTEETEEAARRSIQSSVIDRIARFREVCPQSIPSLGFALGNFNQVPILSVAHHPEVDYKYYLDLQMNRLANDPACRDLGTVGYWGSYYADEELHRWSYALLRHYAVEGRTNMLSQAHGFRYRPDHVLNGDFRKTLAPWTATGDVRLDAHAGFANKSQNRWFARGGVGDTFAALTRTTNGVATLRQTVRGLVPGKMYCLQFATFDVNDVKANALRPRRFGIDAHLSDGATVVPSLSWCHVDSRVKGRYANNDGVARINLRHVVFTAQKTEIELTLDNAAALPGEVLGVNYLSVNPYYAR